MDSSNSNEVVLNDSAKHETKTIIPTFIDSALYKAAAKGQIQPFYSCKEPLDHLLTPTKNTIFHIHMLRYQTPCISFLDEILTRCPSLLLQTNIRGETPLHIAARHGHDTIVKFLIHSAKARHQDIETGAGAALAMLRMENIKKETALHEATRLNHVNVVKVFIEEDPDFTYSANKAGETPLYLAAERGFGEIVVQILNTCTSPAYHGPNGRTALHQAVIRNDSEMTINILKTNKGLVREVDQQGWAPLHHASHFGHLSIVKQLLECNKSMAYLGDKDGKIPLHLAAAAAGGGRSYKEVVYCILEHCPDCHELVDANGRNVVHFAMQSGNYSLLNDIFKIFKYTESADDDYFKPSIANLINEKDVNGNTPLHFAANYCVDSYFLIGHPLVDKMAVNNSNFTPLDVILSSSTNEHSVGYKGDTLRGLKKNGYEKSRRHFIKEKDSLSKVIDTDVIERQKNAHMVVAALIVTVAFAAGFTMPGGYNSEEGSAILSRNVAFKTFIITDAMALLLSTCALFFHFTWGFDALNKRKMQDFVIGASIFIMLAIIFMLMAFAAGAYAVLPHSSNIGAAICVITSLFILICYPPLKILFNSKYIKKRYILNNVIFAALFTWR